MADPLPQRNLILILARNFAARLATAVFLVDAGGSVIFFNEAAERLLGQRFIEGHGMAADEYGKLFQPSDDEGNPIPILETPVGIAFARKRAGTRATEDPRCRWRHAADRGNGVPAARAYGRTRGSDRDLLGARGGVGDASPYLGRPRLDRDARVGEPRATEGTRRASRCGSTTERC